MRFRFFPENSTQKKIAIYGTFAVGTILAIQAIIFKRFQDSIRGLKSLGDEEFNTDFKALESHNKPNLAKITSNLRQATPWTDYQIMLTCFLMLSFAYFALIQLTSHFGIGRRPTENAQRPRESETDSDTYPPSHPE